MREIGPIETSVKGAAARIAMTARVLVIVACTALLPIGGITSASTVVVAAVLAWQAASTVVGRWPRLAAAVDGIPLAAAVLLLPSFHPPHGYLELNDWARTVTTVCVGAAHFYTRPRDGAIHTLVVAAAVWPGSTLVGGDWDLGRIQTVMLLWQGALARCLIVLVCLGARRVDDLTADTVAIRRRAELTNARRADVEEHLAALHDTVAATLTAASSRGAGGPGLLRQARSDLAMLEPAPRIVTLTELTALPADSTLEVTVVLPRTHTVPAIPPHAIGALLAARDEALRNVERHAGTSSARLELRFPASDAVEVDIVDDGCGFRPDDVPLGIHLGLRLSIVARMRRAGGSARVVSDLGRGTRVELRWPTTTTQT
jgi:hypothetical protein